MEYEKVAKDHPNFAIKDLAAYIVKRLKKEDKNEQDVQDSEVVSCFCGSSTE